MSVQLALSRKGKRVKKFRNVRLLILPITFLSFNTVLESKTQSKLEGFDFLKLGMPYSSLVEQKLACDRPRDTPDFRESVSQGVSSTICPTSETFAMATLLEDKIAAVAVNWISWDGKKLQAASPILAQVPSLLRKQYGIPSTTVPYESQFGNPEADAFCRVVGFTCQMHIWKDPSSDRVANLIYAKSVNGEVPLLFNLTDLAAERKIEAIKNRGLKAPANATAQETEQSH